MVEPPTVDQTIDILKGLRDKYEAHHRVKFTDEAVEAAAKLSDRYISGRYLPDKAIDLIDEAGARSRLSVMTVPPDVKHIEERMETVRKEKEQSVKNQDFERAAKFRDEERKLKDELNGIKKEWKESRGKFEPKVTDEDIAIIVSKWTGIPIVKLEEKEQSKFLKMEEGLHKRVIGQDEAISAIAHAVRRSRAGIKDPRRPIGSFVFLGPTGVGKTLVGRALAEYMFGDEDAIIQIDMSEYMEKFNVSRLVGAPPGYVGYEEGGQLTEKVRRRPYSVVLLDEIEKAHPDVFNILLQMLEEGRLTDSFGRKVDFKNTVIIMTSNIGAEALRKQGSIGFKSQEEEVTYQTMKDKLLEEVKKVFKPEFLNRVDDIIVFRSLTREDLEHIVKLETKEVETRLKDQSISLDLTKEAKDFLIERGFDKTFGARPLKRTIQRFLEDPLAEEIIKGTYKNGAKLRVTAKADHLEFASSIT
jgi:ATP-dependent Clp protease ATP-binding subunit ClpC